MTDHLKKIFLDTCARFSPNAPAIVFWKEIEEKYTGSKRYYHNLDHLSSMLQELERCQDLIHEWDCVTFALFYHDYIYKATAKDNEEKSALEATRKLRSLGLTESRIALVSEMILATKSHQSNKNDDINLFTDADLSILGSDQNKYSQYIQQIRKEYSIYPDILYKPGRRKVLKHFLEMPSIFKTSFFTTRFEEQARKNIVWEIGTLGQ